MPKKMGQEPSRKRHSFHLTLNALLGGGRRGAKLEASLTFS